MKTLTVQFFLVMLFSVTMLSCNNNQGARNDENNQDSMAMDNNHDHSMMDQNKDVDFMKDAAYGGLMEVELGKYAQQHAINPRVKNFGTMMVKDHSKANDELKALAANKSISIPTALDEDHLDKVNKMKEKKGADFDKAYMDAMVDDHNKDTDKFKKHAENGNDADIKAFAAKTLPILLMHQDSAKNIRASLK